MKISLRIYASKYVKHININTDLTEMTCFFLPVSEFPGPSDSWSTGTETEEWLEEECGPSNPHLEFTGCLNLVATALTCAVGQMISALC